ncbi:MAG: hypothetical protein ACJ72W_18970 [Actinoallomurus sp.]
MTRAKPPRTATRLCATCGTPFTWTSRNPRRRFCDPICKARWWRVSNRDGDRATSNTGRPNIIGGPGHHTHHGDEYGEYGEYGERRHAPLRRIRRRVRR